MRNVGCCGATEGPARSDDEYLERAQSVPLAAEALRAELQAELVCLPGGIFEMGARRSTFPDDLDSPRRKVKLSPFSIARTTVTNAQFRRFIRETGYSTVAEQEGWSFVFHLLVAEPSCVPQHPPGLPWWRIVEGADWAHPRGPGSDASDHPEHPVTHISWYDALAYCRWAGLRLPTEAQWEYAARGGLARKKFPWGNEIAPAGVQRMNTFRGAFPHRHDDGETWVGTEARMAYPPNGFGLYAMTGNVWEWASDCFGPLPAAGSRPALDPERPAEGVSRVQRGGSYLCHPSYCDRYHVHSRTRNDANSSTGNCGFRVAGDARTGRFA